MGMTAGPFFPRVMVVTVVKSIILFFIVIRIIAFQILTGERMTIGYDISVTMNANVVFILNSYVDRPFARF
jgi:hypothetical protein